MAQVEAGTLRRAETRASRAFGRQGWSEKFLNIRGQTHRQFLKKFLED